MGKQIITLMSDLGVKSPTVAIAKAMLQTLEPVPTIVEITHAIEKSNLYKTAFLISSVADKFPPNTIHIILFDVFHYLNTSLALAHYNGCYFIAPDNGMLPLALSDKLSETWVYHNQPQFCNYHEILEAIKVKISDGVVPDSGSAQLDYWQPKGLKKLPHHLTAHFGKTEIICNVLQIDNFGNLILNLRNEDFLNFTEGRAFKISIPMLKDVTQISKNYCDVAENDLA